MSVEEMKRLQAKCDRCGEVVTYDAPIRGINAGIAGLPVNWSQWRPQGEGWRELKSVQLGSMALDDRCFCAPCGARQRLNADYAPEGENPSSPVDEPHPNDDPLVLVVAYQAGIEEGARHHMADLTEQVDRARNDGGRRARKAVLDRLPGVILSACCDYVDGQDEAELIIDKIMAAYGVRSWRGTMSGG